jgi:hypothetical protein
MWSLPQMASETLPDLVVVDNRFRSASEQVVSHNDLLVDVSAASLAKSPQKPQIDNFESELVDKVPDLSRPVALLPGTQGVSSATDSIGNLGFDRLSSTGQPGIQFPPNFLPIS